MDREAFFSAVRKGILGPTLDKGEVEGCEAIMDAMANLPLSWCAYAIATAYHETAHTMQPISEYGGPKYLTRMYDPLGARPSLAKANGNTTPGDGIKYAGRGYVQLTWKSNYKRVGEKLNIDLVTFPENALRPSVAARIMAEGMQEGWFTGKAFSHFLPGSQASLEQYTAARRIINGKDKAALIAGYAMQFQKALEAGGWR
jgi:putative chitinase